VQKHAEHGVRLPTTKATMALTTTRWIHIRHAPVPDGGNIYGQRDLDCDTSNAAVFKAVAAVVPRNAVWVTSGLKRAKQTAAAVVAGSGGTITPGPMPAFDALNEQHLGDWQGKNRVAFRAERGLTAQSFWLAKSHERTPNGESFLDLMARVHPLIDTLTAEHAGRAIVAVSHGGTIRAAIAHALGLPAETSHAFTIDNCSLTVLEHIGAPGRAGVWKVEVVNHQPWTHTTTAGGTHA
jgi:broad specificity phosphatase PhoE